MDITATQIHYFHLCQRKLWLFSQNIKMEQNSQLVYEGKLIDETSYKRRSKKYTELNLGNVKIDFYDIKNKIVHEVKKSNKVEYVHIAQVKYYLWLLIQHGIDNPTGIIEYPTLRKTTKVELSVEDLTTIPIWINDIMIIIQQDNCPSILSKKSICKKCSYFDFCFV